MRVPKLKGFKNPNKTEYQVVNLDRLSALFPDGGEVDPDVLAAKGAVRRGRLVKILGTGEVGVALQVKAHGFSGTAAQKIAAAGGSVTKL
jgi:large subunit ribosomal protein L15